MADSGSGEIVPSPAHAEVVGVPKWFMVATMSAVIAGSVTAAFGGVKFYAQSAVMADRLERLEAKVDKLDSTLASAAADRWTAAQAAAVESRILRRVEKLEDRVERLGK